MSPVRLPSATSWGLAKKLLLVWSLASHWANDSAGALQPESTAQRNLAFGSPSAVQKRLFSKVMSLRLRTASTRPLLSALLAAVLRVWKILLRKTEPEWSSGESVWDRCTASDQ